MMKAVRELVFLLFVATLMVQTWIAEPYMEAHTAYQVTGFIGGFICLVYIVMVFIEFAKKK